MSAKTVKNPPVAPAFTASAELRSDLQRALVDITALSLVGKQIHWNVVGPNFRDLHLNLDEVVDIAREGSDELAERMRAINAYPDARPATVAEETSVPVAPEGSVITSDAVDYIVAAINAVTTMPLTRPTRPPPASSRTTPSGWSSRAGSSPLRTTASEPRRHHEIGRSRTGVGPGRRPAPDSLGPCRIPRTPTSLA